MLLTFATFVMSSPRYPPTLLQTLLEFSNFVEESKRSDTPREELLMSIEMRLSNLVSKVVAFPTKGAFRVYE